jgi:hypothetical protein
MSVDEKFNAVSHIWRRYGLLFKVLIDTYGIDTTLQHHLEARSKMDRLSMSALKEKRDQLTPEQFAVTIEGNFMKSGYDAEVNLTEDSVEVTIRRCPFYHGMSLAGFSHELIHRVCDSSCSQRAQNFPIYMGIIEFRKTPEGRCIEGFRLTK